MDRPLDIAAKMDIGKIHVGILNRIFFKYIIQFFLYMHMPCGLIDFPLQWSHTVVNVVVTSP